MKIHDVRQGSVEWSLLRAGIPTASEFDNLLTPKFEVRKGEMPKTYLAAKLAEWWQGGALVGFNTFDIEQGQILEGEAKPWYTLETGREVKSVGFITSDDGTVGCSPDGLIGETEGIEIKCPQPTNHVKYLLGGKVPDDYLTQVHGSLYVTGLARWTFLSYRRRFPNLLLTVERDDEICDRIEESLTLFLEQFEDGKARMIEANFGIGPPPKPVLSREPEAAPAWDDGIGVKP